MDTGQGLTKDELKQLLTLTQNERERELIKYAVYKASKATPTEARRQLGIENMKSCAEHIESCIQEVQEIYEAVDVLAYSRDKAVLDTLGIESSSSSSSESSGDEIDFPESGLEYKYPIDGGTSNGRVPDQSVLGQVLCDSNFTRFEFREKTECTMEHSDSCEICRMSRRFFSSSATLKPD